MNQYLLSTSTVLVGWCSSLLFGFLICWFNSETRKPWIAKAVAAICLILIVGWAAVVDWKVMLPAICGFSISILAYIVKDLLVAFGIYVYNWFRH